MAPRASQDFEAIPVSPSSPDPEMKLSLLTSEGDKDGDDGSIDDVIELHDLESILEDIESTPERLWNAALGLSACFEILSFVLPYLFLSPEETTIGDEMFGTVKAQDPRPRFQWLSFLPENKKTTSEETGQRNLFHWFDDNRYMLGVLFSTLWFVHAFVRAWDFREERLIRKERELLLGSIEKERKEKEGDGNDDDRAKGAESNDEMAYDIGGAWWAYPLKVLNYFLLLPVGFYLLSLADFSDIFFGNGGIDDTTADGLILGDEEDAIAFGNKVITKETKYCLAYAVVVYIRAAISKFIGTTVKVKAMTVVKSKIKKMTAFALRHPLKSRKRLLRALEILRWVKYLAPLIGTGNKLLGNTLDLLKKYRQTLEATRAKRIRARLWKTLSPEERKERAAVVIQANYRAHRVRMAERAVRFLQMKEQDAAVLKIQAILRRKAAEARVRVLLKKQELRKLKMQQLDMEKQHRKMSVAERKRLYTLQDELGIEFNKSRGSGLLLRPNTRFAVAWKILFVICVVIEITQLALKPKLATFKDEKTGKPLDIELVLERVLVPTPFGELPECIIKDSFPPNRVFVQMPFVREKNKTLHVDKDLPWYCHKPYTTASAIFAWTLRHLILDFLSFIVIICFMDVFVTFFTGELDPETGVLRPKPFIARWLVPGLVLQLLVNPKMVNVASQVRKLRWAVHYAGPARVFRWFRVFIIPAFWSLADWFEWAIWRRLVQKENRQIQ